MTNLLKTFILKNIWMSHEALHSLHPSCVFLTFQLINNCQRLNCFPTKAQDESLKRSNKFQICNSTISSPASIAARHRSRLTIDKFRTRQTHAISRFAIEKHPKKNPNRLILRDRTLEISKKICARWLMSRTTHCPKYKLDSRCHRHSRLSQVSIYGRACVHKTQPQAANKTKNFAHKMIFFAI